MNGEGFDNFMEVAQLGTQTFLANQVITSSRPSTYAVDPNGQMIVSGGGASSPISGFSWKAIGIGIGLLVVLVLVFRGLGGHR